MFYYWFENQCYIGGDWLNFETKKIYVLACYINVCKKVGKKPDRIYFNN